MIVITGWRSQIAVEFKALLPKGEVPVWGRVVGGPFPLSADRYLFCQGLLYPKTSAEQTEDEIKASIKANYGSIAIECRRIFAVNDRARVCIIGSESAYHGSYDGTYAASKRKIHNFVENLHLESPHQQLVAISPGIIEDAGMTTRRTDVENLDRRRAEHPKRRFVTSIEVAKMAHFLLYGSDYVTGTVVRMHGGQR